MADTYTTNYNLTKPEVGFSTDTWGVKSNANLDAIDAALASLQIAVNGKAPTAHTHTIADVTNLQTTLDLKAPLANPNFTGAATFGGSATFTGTATFNGDAVGVTLAFGDSSTKLATTAFVQAALVSAVPAGTLIFFIGNSAPAGYVKANGALLSRTAYAKLFAAIGTLYGAGDGSTTFKIPDLRGEFIRVWDDGRGVDGGRPFGTWQSDLIASHDHTATVWAAGGHQHTIPQAGGNYYQANGAGLRPQDTVNGAVSYTSVVGDHSHAITIYAAGGAETRPRNIALLACIKY